MSKRLIISLFILIIGILGIGLVVWNVVDKREDKEPSQQDNSDMQHTVQESQEEKENERKQNRIDLGEKIGTFDRDGDGLSDTREEEIGTDPDNPDTDGDGYSDGLEIVTDHDPLSA